MATPENAPWLEDYYVASQVADALKVTRQTVNQMIHAGKFSTLTLVGKESRPQYLVQKAEVQKMLDAQNLPVPA